MSVFDAFSKEAQTIFKKAREEGAKAAEGDDFKSQQELYQKFSSVYDEYLEQEESASHRYHTLCKMICDAVEHDKRGQAYLLDYGCGTGPVAEYLVKEYGFKTIDGNEPNQGLLEVARSKGTMRNLHQIGSSDDHSQLGEKQYDVLISTGVFFVSPSHPDLSCLEKLCRLVKQSGYIFICSGESYMKYVDMEPADQLARDGKIKNFPQLIFKRYRKATPEEEGDFVDGVILKYQVLC